MTRGLAFFSLLIAPGVLGAQSLAQRVTEADGLVQVIYPSRPSACGDGEHFIGHVLGRSTFYSGDATYSGHGSWSTYPCVHGPARVVATIVDREVTRLRAYVGPVPASRSESRVITASAADAAAWLGGLATHGTARAASQAILPLVLADAPDPWPLLLRIARDDDRPREVRRAATTWLASGVTDHLGLADARDDTDDDELRAQAVFALSQRRGESVDALIDVVRTSPHASARRAAIFWLGQTGDRRAVDLYEQLLARRP